MLKNSPLFSNTKGDLIGGFTAAVVTLPAIIIYGTIAFAPLGNNYVGMGILAGIFCSVFAGFFAAVFGGTKAMVSGPQAPSALVFGATISQLLATGLFKPEFLSDVQHLVTLLFGAVLLAGIFQILFGIFKIGTLVKFIPYPVIAGILSGTGVLILKSQLFTFLGVPKQSFSQLIQNFNTIQPLTLLIALSTAFLMWKGTSIFKKIPKNLSSLLAIVGGTAIYYLFVSLGLSKNLGAVIGELPKDYPIPKYAIGFFEIFSQSVYFPLISTVLVAGFTMAVLSSIDSLLSSVSLQSVTNERSDTNRELRAQGIGTVVSSLFGGLPGTGYTNRSLVNFYSGGRTKLSGIAYSVTILLLALFFRKAIGFIPQCVMAGVVLVVGILMIDIQSLRGWKKIIARQVSFDNELAWNTAIVVVVACITMFFDLIVAVGIGMVVSITLLVIQMSISPIRNRTSGAAFQSNKQRNDTLSGILELHNKKILILELEGNLFFGSADALALEIENMPSQHIEYVVLDMNRVNRFDSTAGKILCQSIKNLQEKGILFTISYINRKDKLYEHLADFGLIDLIGTSNVFDNTNLAIEHCEDKLLTKIVPGLINSRVELNELLGFSHLSEDDRSYIFDIIGEGYIKRETFEVKQVIIKQGDKAETVYFIHEGKAEIMMEIPKSDSENETIEKHIQTLDIGTYFGEAVLFGETLRTMNVIATEPTICYSVSKENFERLKSEFPRHAEAIINTINKTLMFRLQHAYKLISELET